VAALEAEFGRKPGYITKTLLPSVDNLSEGDSPFVTTRQCEAYKITEEVACFITEKAMELEGDTTWDELAQLAASEFADTCMQAVAACGGGNDYERHKP
jgi:hypothetical protein